MASLIAARSRFSSLCPYAAMRSRANVFVSLKSICHWFRSHGYRSCHTWPSAGVDMATRGAASPNWPLKVSNETILFVTLRVLSKKRSPKGITKLYMCIGGLTSSQEWSILLDRAPYPRHNFLRRNCILWPQKSLFYVLGRR
ncbi:hypothetical protein M408DRAFT_229091 [Serendipita vermifera MAFF 305830]|uniref:Uncharacterized protein n=1 Tax=Serendipita vermifera MAFF 305830 TaxID=933852 RepID=A0A0C3AJJ9_SERVB|nr:hypothetical protein M408DRAFT_229091 [Serendipita vermifera MAFF 305830]